jgi:RNA polymerase sigma-70 factor (ECF subfamily)
VSHPLDPTPDGLLSHAGFVRALARATLRGDSEAEDLEQDVWLAALRGGPDRPTERRSWLAGVVRRRGAEILRLRTRRARRELRAAKPEALGAQDAVERAEAGRRLVAAVLRLREPFRTAILLRYLEDMTPRAVAERLCVPVETVRTRVHRGLLELRRALAEERDDLKALIVPLAGVGGTIVTKHAVTAAVVILLLAGGGVALHQAARSDRETRAGDAAPVTVEEASAAALSGRLPEGSSPAGEAGEPSAAQAPARAPDAVRGVVVDEDGNPVPGAVVFVREPSGSHLPRAGGERDGSASAQTAPDGSFELAGTPGSGVRVRAPGYVQIERGDAAYPTYPSRTEGGRVVLHRGPTLRVRVVEASSGRPVAGARVRAYTAGGYLLHSAGDVNEARSDADGWAPLTVPPGPVHALVDAEGFAQCVRWGVEVPAAGAETELRLFRGGTVRGVVLDPAGRPVARATVGLIRAPRVGEVRTAAEDGTFAFTSVPPREDPELSGVARSIAVLVVTTSEHDRQYRALEPPPEGGVVEAVVRLDAASSLEGRVVDAGGVPVQGARVYFEIQEGRDGWGWLARHRHPLLTDGAGAFRTPPLPPGTVRLWAPPGDADGEPARTVQLPTDERVELVAGEAPRTVEVRVVDALGAPVHGVLLHVAPGSGSTVVRTDESGSARVRVAPEGRRLVVDAPRSGPAVVSLDPAAGPVHVRLGAGRIEGSARRTDGTPARVRLMLSIAIREDRGAGTSMYSWYEGTAGGVETDADGAFAFEHLSPGEYFARLLTPGFRLLEEGSKVTAGARGLRWTVLTLAEADLLTASVELVAPDGTPFTDVHAYVDAQNAVGERHWMKRRGGTGEFRSTAPLAPGRWTLRATAPGHQEASAEVHVSLGSQIPLTRLVLRSAR